MTDVNIQTKIRFVFEVSSAEFQLIVEGLQALGGPQAETLALELQDQRDARYADMARKFQAFLQMNSKGGGKK